MTFENFYFGNTYRFALDMAKNIADYPDGTYNPVIFYGPSRVGKTHLLTAIYNQLKETRKDMHIINISADGIIEELIDSIIKGEKTAFHQKYNYADIIMVDNFELVSNNEQAKEELFLIFDEYIKNKKQIILCVTEFDNNSFSKKIKTRLNSGILIEMKIPDDKTKKQIIDFVSDEWNLKLNENQKQCILKRTNTPNEFISVLKCLSNYSMSHKNCTRDLIEILISLTLSKLK